MYLFNSSYNLFIYDETFFYGFDVIFHNRFIIYSLSFSVNFTSYIQYQCLKYNVFLEGK